MKRLVWTFWVAALPLSASAFEIGESEHVFSGDLAKRGFVPSAVSSTTGASFGMTDGEALYLCFRVDQPADQMRRRKTLIEEGAGQATEHGAEHSGSLRVDTMRGYGTRSAFLQPGGEPRMGFEGSLS